MPLSDELSQGSPCEAKVLGTCFSHGVPCITRQCQHAPETSCLFSRHESRRAYPHISDITLISSFAIPSKEVLASSRRLGSRTNRPRPAVLGTLGNRSSRPCETFFCSGNGLGGTFAFVPWDTSHKALRGRVRSSRETQRERGAAQCGDNQVHDWRA